jgi:hypothetical protein
LDGGAGVGMVLAVGAAAAPAGGTAGASGGVGAPGPDTAGTTVTTIAPQNNSTTDQQGLSTALPGVETSASEIAGAEMTENELLLTQVEQEIINFEPQRFVLGTIAARATDKRFAEGMEVEYYAIGSGRKTAQTSSAYDPGSGKPATTPLPFVKTDAVLFTLDSIVIARVVQGYLPDGVTVDPKHELQLQVVGRTQDGNNSPIFYAINGPRTATTDTETYVPAIAAQTTIVLLNTAMGESQLFTEPISSMPRPTRVYMQRQALNIQITEFFERQKKKVRYGREDVLEHAIREFRSRVETQYLLGVQSKRTVENSNMQYGGGQKLVYTSEGLLWQMRQNFTYTKGSMTYNNLLALTKQMFSGNNGARRALVLAGEGLVESIMKIDYSIYKDLSIGNKEHWGINMTDYTSPFGTLSLLHYPMLDEIEMPDNGMVIDVDRLYRYVYAEPYHKSVDMQVHGQEAKRDIYVQTDCLVLKGDNNIFIKPAA